MKKLVINCNDCFALYTFRLELLKVLRKSYKLFIIASWDSYYPLLIREGFEVINSQINSSGKNIFKDIKLIFFYRKTLRRIGPDLIINYTIKPHIYGTIFSKKTKVINFVSGVGSVFLNHNLVFYLVRVLYRMIAKKVDLYIFLNYEDLTEFKKCKFIQNRAEIVKGEGVVLSRFFKELDLSLPPTFIFIGRLIKEKGIYEYLEAAKDIKEKYPGTRFLVVGSFYEKDSVIDQELINSYQTRKIIEYLGHSKEVNEILRKVHVVVLPSYREGMPISLIEGLASKKVLIASDVEGCRDICHEGYNGFLVEPKNIMSLVAALEKYLNFENKVLLHEYALESSYEFAKEFYLERMVDLIENI